MKVWVYFCPIGGPHGSMRSEKWSLLSQGDFFKNSDSWAPSQTCWIKTFGRKMKLLLPRFRGLSSTWPVPDSHPVLQAGSDPGSSLQKPRCLSPHRLTTPDASPTSPRSIPDTPVWSHSPSPGLPQHFSPHIHFSVCCFCPQTFTSARVETIHLCVCSPSPWARFEPTGSIPSLDALDRDLDIYLHTKINQSKLFKITWKAVNLRSVRH